MRVLVIEDEQKVASLIKAGLEQNGFDVVMTHDGNTGGELASVGGFDAVVLDIMIPGRDGLSLLRKLRNEHNIVPVVLLSARGDTQERIEGLNFGADDYLTKPFSMLELVARLNAVLRRRTGAGLTTYNYGGLSLNLTSREAKRDGKRIELTPREFSLLECLMRDPGKVITRVEISQSVWGHQFDPGTNFVDVAIQRLRRKVDGPFPRNLIQTIRGVGYAIQDDQ